MVKTLHDLMYAIIVPRAWEYKIMQNFYHSQYLMPGASVIPVTMSALWTHAGSLAVLGVSKDHTSLRILMVLCFIEYGMI